MLAVTILVSTFAVTPVARPRDCALCGVYAGPNVARVLDPYLRQRDIWPEFVAASCRFEVARGSFVRLSQGDCAAESIYRSARGVS